MKNKKRYDKLSDIKVSYQKDFDGLYSAAIVNKDGAGIDILGAITVYGWGETKKEAKEDLLNNLLRKLNRSINEYTRIIGKVVKDQNEK